MRGLLVRDGEDLPLEVLDALDAVSRDDDVAAQVAECVVNALRDETFLVLPHPEVLDYLRGKTANYDKWLGGMQKLYSKAGLGEGKA